MPDMLLFEPDKKPEIPAELEEIIKKCKEWACRDYMNITPYELADKIKPYFDSWLGDDIQEFFLILTENFDTKQSEHEVESIVATLSFKTSSLMTTDKQKYDGRIRDLFYKLVHDRLNKYRRMKYYSEYAIPKFKMIIENTELYKFDHIEHPEIDYELVYSFIKSLDLSKEQFFYYSDDISQLDIGKRKNIEATQAALDRQIEEGAIRKLSEYLSKGLINRIEKINVSEISDVQVFNALVQQLNDIHKELLELDMKVNMIGGNNIAREKFTYIFVQISYKLADFIAGRITFNSKLIEYIRPIEELMGLLEEIIAGGYHVQAILSLFKNRLKSIKGKRYK